MLCDYCGVEHCDNLRCRGYGDSPYYVITIPKEEYKQETLEEAAEKVIKILEDFDSKRFTKAGFKLGAKWQQEQDKNLYSEEEVLEIIDLLFHRYASSSRIDAKEYFLQFKKK